MNVLVQLVVKLIICWVKLTMSTLSVFESTPSALVIKLLWTLASKVLTASTLLDISFILTSTTSCVPCVQIQGHVFWYEDCGKKMHSFLI